MNVLQLLGSSLKTLYLFTKSDIKTVILPIPLMAASCAPWLTLSHLPHAVFWVWLHVLQYDVSNQILDPTEDERNKSYRPLPAKRISLEKARILRWLLIPLCLALSACYGRSVVFATISLITTTVLHNELHAHRTIWGKNFLTALTLGAFEVGAILIMGDNRAALSEVAQMSLFCSVAIYAMTIYAQDFKDVEGDAAIGRKTIPMNYPTLAAPVLATFVQAWSVFLMRLWQVDLVIATLFGSLAVAVALFFMMSKTVVGYQRAFYLYNAWVSFVHCLPLFSKRSSVL